MLFLYLTNEVEFEQDILQDCVTSICVLFLVNLDDLFSVVCKGFYEVMVSTIASSSSFSLCCEFLLLASLVSCFFFKSFDL